MSSVSVKTKGSSKDGTRDKVVLTIERALCYLVLIIITIFKAMTSPFRYETAT